jgi:hypothetical protein
MSHPLCSTREHCQKSLDVERIGERCFALDPAIDLDEPLADRRESVPAAVFSALCGFHRRRFEGSVQFVHQQPGSSVGHLEPLCRRRQGPCFPDRFKQSDLARTDCDPLARRNAQPKSDDRSLLGYRSDAGLACRLCGRSAAHLRRMFQGKRGRAQTLRQSGAGTPTKPSSVLVAVGLSAWMRVASWPRRWPSSRWSPPAPGPDPYQGIGQHHRPIDQALCVRFHSQNRTRDRALFQTRIRP